eukprot:SAG11_NODE_4357_length_1934_cov_1.202725_3_plen_147_part_00
MQPLCGDVLYRNCVPAPTVGECDRAHGARSFSAPGTSGSGGTAGSLHVFARSVDFVNQKPDCKNKRGEQLVTTEGSRLSQKRGAACHNRGEQLVMQPFINSDIKMNKIGVLTSVSMPSSHPTLPPVVADLLWGWSATGAADPNCRP